MIAYKLNFISPLHVDSRGTSFYEKTDEFVRSDTLTAAIVSCWHNLYEDSIDELAAYPPFVLSSAFPYYADIYFFPIPFAEIVNEPADISENKKIKKIKWLSQDLFEMILSGQQIDWDKKPPNLIGETFALSSKDILSCGVEPCAVTIMAMHERPRIAVNRIGDSVDEGAFFYFAEYYFHEDAGLFFLAEFNNDAIREKFESVLRLLGDQGLGADRSVGKGAFTVERDRSFEFNVSEGPNYWLLLSLYSPCREEIESSLLKGASYDLTSRGGWISGTSLKRPPIRMFTEGSVFRKRPVGRVVELFSKKQRQLLNLHHPIFRHGKAFCLPMKG